MKTALQSPERVAVIDVGSASVRLFAAERIAAGSWHVLADDREMTRLAEGLAGSGRLDPLRVEASIAAIERMLAIAAHHACAVVGVFATAAVRDAANRLDLVQTLHARTGVPVTILSEAEEGAIVHAAAAKAFNFDRGPAAVADLGGGSMQCIQSVHGVIWNNRSVPLGSVRLTEQFGGPVAASGSRFSELREHVAETIAGTIDTPPRVPDELVGCGGTFTTMGLLHIAARTETVTPVSRGELGALVIERIDLKALIERLRETPVERRVEIPGMPRDRADLILSGVVVIERLLKHLGIERLRVHAGGLREGLADRLFDGRREPMSQPTPGDDESAALSRVRAFAVRAAYSREHSEQVARLSLMIFDALAAHGAVVPGLGSDPRERRILEAAAVLHDIGGLVEYRRHHKRSRDMILNSGLDRPVDGAPHLDPDELRLIAVTARYHRRALPSEDHEEFDALPSPERDLVSRLAAILRIADAYDRSHDQSVASMRVKVERMRITFIAVLRPRFAEETLRSNRRCEPELLAAAEKSDLFESLLPGRTLVFTSETGDSAP